MLKTLINFFRKQKKSNLYKINFSFYNSTNLVRAGYRPPWTKKVEKEKTEKKEKEDEKKVEKHDNKHTQSHGNKNVEKTKKSDDKPEKNFKLKVEHL